VQSEISNMGVLSNVRRGPDCVADGKWLNVAAGLLPEGETSELLKHAALCGYCGPLLKRAAETLTDEVTPSEETSLASLSSARPEWRRNMATTLRGGMRLLRPPSVQELLAQAYTEYRTLEVRIDGATYAQVRERSADKSDKPPSLLQAEALIGEKLNKNPNDPTWLQAHARANLMDGNYEAAIESLQHALEEEPDSPGLLTDLGSAYFLRAESGNRPADLGNAIESFDQALAKSPEDPVALFNRAVACERMCLYAEAIHGWECYLRVDPQGEWPDDARKRLATLKQKRQ
jgi:tetratricopeptide (TPR) repeat protein